MRHQKLTRNPDGTFLSGLFVGGSPQTFSDVIFASDFHFGHNKAFIYENRGFSSIEEHDAFVLSAMRDARNDGKLLVYLGDFTIGHTKEQVVKILENFPTTLYVKGNHELFSDGEFRSQIPANIFLCNDIFNLSIGKKSIFAQHFPCYDWNKKEHGAWHIHGHVHGKLSISHPESKEDRILDVGVDVSRKFSGKPYFTFDEVSSIMESKCKKPIQ